MYLTLFLSSEKVEAKEVECNELRKKVVVKDEQIAEQTSQIATLTKKQEIFYDIQKEHTVKLVM